MAEAKVKLTMPTAEEREKHNYIERMTDLLRGVAERTRVSLQFMLSQTAFETGWGKIRGNNLFGMTTSPSDGWTGGRIKVGKRTFRTYSSWEECIEDYEKWLHKPRYNRILDADVRDDVMKCGLALQEGQWDDENYAANIFEVSKGPTMTEAIRQYEPGLYYKPIKGLGESEQPNKLSETTENDVPNVKSVW